MAKGLGRRLAALFIAVSLLLCGCSPTTAQNAGTDDDSLTMNTWRSYNDFHKLLAETRPDLPLSLISYTGCNQTGYSWAQMQADDIPDFFITSQILDEELAAERLVDLSAYPFINRFSTSILDQVAIDGGVYLLPVNSVMYGIYYNKTLMEEHGWTLPNNFAELETLCEQIREAGLIPGVIGTQLTGNTFSTVFNLAKTSWLTTPAGLNWERSFLNGEASAEGTWEDTMDYVQKYIDIGMFQTDPEDRGNPTIILDYLGSRKAVFATAVLAVSITELPETGDQLGLMPFISEDGSKNIYMYSPSSYIGISKRLTEPGNEEKLEQAIEVLSLLFSEEGQDAFINEQTPCISSVLDHSDVGADSMIFDAQQAFQEGRAFPMTYAHWEDILAGIGQSYKDWFRGENGMDGPKCIAAMDKQKQDALKQADQLYFCESTADFTLQETAKLIAKAVGSGLGADAVMIPLGGYHENGSELYSGVTGKLYQGKINLDVVSAISPYTNGDFLIMEMTGADANTLVQEGFDAYGDGMPFEYLLVTKGDIMLKDDTKYRIAFLPEGYTEQTAAAHPTETVTHSLTDFLHRWLEQQETVSPDGNPW